MKTKNKFYFMRATLARMQFDVIKFEPHRTDNGESKVYPSKQMGLDTLRRHLTSRTVMDAA